MTMPTQTVTNNEAPGGQVWHVDGISARTGDLIPNAMSHRLAPGESCEIEVLEGMTVRVLTQSQWDSMHAEINQQQEE